MPGVSGEGMRDAQQLGTETGVAHCFATEGVSSRPPGTVYVARVHPDYLPPFIEEGHEEYEWVVDPNGLNDETSAISIAIRSD